MQQPQLAEVGQQRSVSAGHDAAVVRRTLTWMLTEKKGVLRQATTLSPPPTVASDAQGGDAEN